MTEQKGKQGPVLSGEFQGPVAAGGGEAVDLRGSQGAVYKPSGPVCQIIQQRYPLLKDYVYDVDTDIKRVTQGFVGRAFVFDWLKAQLHEPPCGYLRLVADAGLGKTTIAAEVARRYGALVHFVNASEGVTRPDQCLNSLCAQLIARYGLPHDHLPERAGQDANFLQTLLQEAAAKRGDAPVLLVIDALDEADPVAAGRNWLLLPNHLPEGVYVLLTHRPGNYTIDAAAQMRQPEPLVIAWDDPRQQGDIAAHLWRQAERPEIRCALKEAVPPIAVEQFVSALQAAAEGNFKYLDYVLGDIVTKKPGFDPLDLQGLPRGLHGYYEHFWQQMQPGIEAPEAKWEAWETRHLPILEGLGVAGEPVPARWLADQTDLSKRTVQRILANWQRFLRCERREGDVITWRIVHRSFADFLAEKEEVNLPEAHRRVAAWYLDAWGGLKAGLPGLQEPEKRDLDGGYGLRHLALHLHGAGNVDELLSLIEDSKWQRARRRDDPAGSGLAQDVEWACRAAEAGDLATLTQYVVASLLKARLRSQITNLPVEAIEALARLDHFDQALALANLIFSEARRITALWRLGQWCLEKGDLDTAVDLLKQARAGILALEKDKNRPSHLARLASYFHQAQQPGEAQRSLDVAFELVNTLEGEVERGSALVALVRGMYDYDAAMLGACLAEVERAVGQIERIHSYRALALARIAEQLYRIDAEHARTLVKEALSILSSAPASYGDEGISGVVFSRRDVFLATVIGIAARIGLEDQGLGLLQTIEDNAVRATAYAELGRAHVDQQHTGEAKTYLQQALAIAETELKGVTLNSFKRRLVNLLLRISQVDQAQQVTENIQDQTERVNAFCAVAEHLSQNGRVEDAHNWLEQMGIDWGKAFGKAVIGATLIELDPDSALEEVSEALQLARQIREGIVGTRHNAYVLIAGCIRKLADTRPKQAKELLDQIVEDLQSAVGRHSLEITGVTQAHNKALACLVKAIASSGHYTEGAKIANSIAHGYVRDQAVLFCVRVACAVSDWDAADTLLSEMTDDCWQLIGKAARQGWQAQTDQALDEILEIIEERVSEACSWFSRPTDALGYTALELGISGHIAAAQDLWAKMDNSIARQESQVELVQLLTQAGRVEDAQRLVNDIEYASSKAQTLAYVARFYSDKDPSRAQALVDQAWKEINPHNIPPEHWIRGWHTDKSLTVLAGTVARWNLSEADRIVKEWIKEDDSRQRARGGVIAAISTIDPQSAYMRLKEIVAEGASSGLAGFWQSLAACSEALYKLVGAENILHLYQHIVLIEQGATTALAHEQRSILARKDAVMSKWFTNGYALIIGVGADLPNTADDAQGLADILKDEGRCAYPPGQVQCLTGPAATRDAVLAALDALAQRTDAEATVVIYFSGHGYKVSTSMDDVYFLMPYGYDLNKLKTTAIKGAEFAAKLRVIPAKKLLVLLDCCHAGGVGDAKAPGLELVKSPLPPEDVALLAAGRGRVLIASSQEDELSFAGKPYSAFTLALIEALSGEGVAKKDGYVRVADVALHARQVVPGRTKQRQHPILHFEHADNFVLAYYAGGDTQPKGLPFLVESVEIEPEPGAWRIGGDMVMEDKTTVFDQRG